MSIDQIRMATEEDRQWEIDYWAALFKATTWEENKMLAEKNPILEDAVKTLYEMSEEEQIREQCMAREDYYRTINTYEAEILDRDQRLEEKDQQIEELMQEVRRLREQQNIDAE